jgi:hypothetical protein
MPTYQESGLEVVLPPGEGFRISECSAYQDLKGKCLKEMDFAWWCASSETLWLLELEEFEWLSPDERLPDYLLERFVAKATDSLLILSSVWFCSLRGTQFQTDLPPSCHSFPNTPKRMKLVFVLKANHTSVVEQFRALKDRLRNRLEGRIALFDMKKASVMLMDQNIAISAGLPISII